MTIENYLILIILVFTVWLFLQGKLRHDLVALLALLACVMTGLISSENAFSGFSNPAVITVAAVLVLSNGLQTSGAVDILAQRVLPKNAGLVATVAVLLILGAALSAIMNNVGAMALLMPIAIQIAQKSGVAPGKVLMPLAFATILGGMTTLIGTPPNLIVSGYREEALGAGYQMFDFSPVGGAIVLVGLAFLILFAKKLVPERKARGTEDFDVGKYQTELQVVEGSEAEGMSIEQVETSLEHASAIVLGLIRDDDLIYGPSNDVELQIGDVLIIQAYVSLLQEGIVTLGLRAPSSIKGYLGVQSKTYRELVIKADSPLIGRTAKQVQIATYHGVNLVAISRSKMNVSKRLNETPLKAGDALLMRGDVDLINEFALQMECVPLAKKELELQSIRAPLIASLIMGLSIFIAVTGWLSTAMAFTLGAVLIVLFDIVPARRLYNTIDWPVVVLLAAMLPVASAMQSTGTADLIARFMLDNLAQGNHIIALTLILVLTMFLSDVMNNAATAAVMCPIAIQSADALGGSPDTFLMAVAIGASCAFLTPIGHQNNTLILGPGGFKFGDYWKFGLPLEIVIVAVAIPLLLFFWPFIG